MKKVESAKWDAQRPIEKLEIKHSERMTDSEKEKFALIKSINDIEMELQKLEASLALQKQQIKEYGILRKELELGFSTTLEYF